MNVYMDTVRWFCRPSNTDWRYNFMLGSLPDYEPDLNLYYPRSRLHQLWVNIDHCRQAIGHRLPRVRAFLGAMPQTYAGHLCARELEGAQCDVVFSHRDFPMNAGRIPVVWQNSVLDPHMSSAIGISVDAIRQETAAKRKLFSRSAAVQVSTEAEVRRLSAEMPELDGRFRYAPFFLPHLGACEKGLVVRKQADPGKLRFLFVGREARRKGLPETILALEKIGFGKRPDAELTVVSDFRDGSVSIPAWTNLRWYKSLDREAVMRLLEESHVLLMPSRFESYGFVYLEAMSKGVVPVVPDWEVQRELIDHGRCGVAVKVGSRELPEAVLGLLEDGSRRMQMALESLKRFESEYAPARVAAVYRRIFEFAVARHDA